MTRRRNQAPPRIGPVLNIKVSYLDEQYSIEVQGPSLFQYDTVSWDRIVNGVDKYVTESMPTAKEEDIASVKSIAKARPRQKPTVTLASVSILFLRGNESTLKHNDHTIRNVMKWQKLSLDLYYMNQSLEDSTERSTTVTSSKSAGVRRHFAMVT